MTIEQLSAKFQQGINWNVLLYTLHKVITTALTFFFYASMTTQDFSAWANINSIVFLLLLWLDFGLRKSIPRYSPDFSQNKASHKHFIRSIITFQALVLCSTALLLVCMPKSLAHTLYMTTNTTLYHLAALLFITEGLVGVFRLIYHAHFEHKRFNTFCSLAFTAETLALLCIITYLPAHALLPALLLTKIASGSCIIIASTLQLRSLYCAIAYPETPTENNPQLYTTFIKHSLIMWGNTTVKSLSERNFMVPFLTHTIGAPIANAFKLANDSALLFQRSLIKSIGTADTSLLAHTTTLDNADTLLPQAFQKLTNTVTQLCLIVSLIMIGICSVHPTLTTNSHLFQLFCCITLGYFIEALLSPFERVLEVKGHYQLLYKAYTPYALGIIICIAGRSFLSSLGLIYIIAILHTLRIMGSLLMARYARTLYQLPLPTDNLKDIIAKMYSW